MNYSLWEKIVMHVLESGTRGILPHGLISHYRWCIILIASSGGSCVTGDSGIVGWSPLFRKNSNVAGRNEKDSRRQRKREKEWGKKRQSRALVWGSRRLIHVSKWDRHPSLPPDLSPCSSSSSFRDTGCYEVPYSVKHCAPSFADFKDHHLDIYSKFSVSVCTYTSSFVQHNLHDIYYTNNFNYYLSKLRNTPIV